MKGLLLELADAVQHAVAALEGDPSEVLGRGADGAPSTRIDRVAEETVLRVLDYEGAALNGPGGIRGLLAGVDIGLYQERR